MDNMMNEAVGSPYPLDRSNQRQACTESHQNNIQYVTTTRTYPEASPEVVTYSPSETNIVREEAKLLMETSPCKSLSIRLSHKYPMHTEHNVDVYDVNGTVLLVVCACTGLC